MSRIWSWAGKYLVMQSKFSADLDSGVVNLRADELRAFALLDSSSHELPQSYTVLHSLGLAIAGKEIAAGPGRLGRGLWLLLWGCSQLQNCSPW